MKEQLQANLFTKYIAGLCTEEEEKYLESWLKNNPSNQMFLGIIRQNYGAYLQSTAKAA
jgi:hypothetical protein